jgi:hypothetical protein
MERSRKYMPWLIVGALLFAGLALVGVPLGSLLVLGLVLMCPLMMMGMHMGSGHGEHAGSEHRDSAHDVPASVRPLRPDVYEPPHH